MEILVQGYVITGKLGDKRQFYSPSTEKWEGNVQNLRMSDIQSVQSFAEQMCNEETNPHVTDKKVAVLTISME